MYVKITLQAPFLLEHAIETKCETSLNRLLNCGYISIAEYEKIINNST